MKYIIIKEGYPPFFTNRNDWENILTEGMMVINTQTDEYSHNGLDWYLMAEDVF